MGHNIYGWKDVLLGSTVDILYSESTHDQISLIYIQSMQQIKMGHNIYGWKDLLLGSTVDIVYSEFTHDQISLIYNSKK